MKLKQTLVIGLVVLFLASCSTTKKAPRKCDGRKGIKTSMGTM